MTLLMNPMALRMGLLLFAAVVACRILFARIGPRGKT